MSIVWIDLETTGLEPTTDAILEVAAVVTTDALEEVAAFEAVTDGARGFALGSLHKNVQEMHLANGLWFESLSAGRPVAEVCTRLQDFIIGAGAQKSPLAGSGVHFDRAFLRQWMRPAHDLLHYRNICMSTLYETAKRFWPAVADGGPRPDGRHRAMSDIRGSIATYRYYLREIVPWGTNARSSLEPAFADVDFEEWNRTRLGPFGGFAGATMRVREPINELRICTGVYDNGCDGNVSPCSASAGCGHSGCPSPNDVAARAARAKTDDPRDWPHGGCQ